MLKIHFSNRFEILAERLVEALETGTGGPGGAFAADESIVPSAAVRRRLTLLLADRHGICANLRCSYLARWLWEQIARILPGVQDESPFAPPLLAWRILAALDDAAWLASQPRLAAWVGTADAAMRYELATRVAELFDRYITYRPEWLQAWARAEPAGIRVRSAAGAEPDDVWSADERWQAALWRRLAAAISGDKDPAAGRHPAAEFVEALQRLGPAGARAAGLPASVHVFALPSIPPLHLGLLQQLGRVLDVHVYAPNPCREYWFEIVDPRQLGRLALEAPGEDTGYREVGHPLLAAWGRQAQSQLGLLVGACGEAATDDADYAADPAPTLLARLQNAILDLETPVPGAWPLQAGDRSIELHVCHSLTRELEVLQDRLLSLLAGDSPPPPSEILVVVPDLDAAAPTIDAVFGTAPKSRALPYRISGRAGSQVNPIARSLLALLALLPSRWPASAVFGLLQQPPVARRYGLDDEDLAVVHGWLLAAGVHWGEDAAHRERLGLPASARHTLADGLERLMLGYALPAQADEPFDGRLPAGDAEGSAALALGALWRFADDLKRLRAAMAQPLPAGAWTALLLEALASFTAADDSELEDAQTVREAIATLGDQWARSGLAAPTAGSAGLDIGLDVVRAALTDLLDTPARGGVAGGGITFSSMNSLRGLPFRVVCLLGLNDGDFPSMGPASEFDLMALAPRPGDRQRRVDDRNLFLDLLLAARERLHLSCSGRSLRDNAPLPPSVLVAELLDHLLPLIAEPGADGAVEDKALAAARRSIVVEHPLQAFSVTAFSEDSALRLRSHNEEYAAALRHAAELADAPSAGRNGDSGAGTRPAAGDESAEDGDDEGASDAPALPFFSSPLSEPGAEWHELALDDLIRFFRNPCAALLRGRLGIRLRGREDELADEEAFVADFAGRRALAARLLPALRAGLDDEAALTLAEAGGELPEGSFGRPQLLHELALLQGHAERWRETEAEPCLPPHVARVEIDLDGTPWRVHAAFADLRPGGLVRGRYDDTRPADRLAAWLAHLMLCADPPAGAARHTRWLSRDGEFALRPCERPHEVLHTLLRLYRDGLREPLAFFPKSAWVYASEGESVSGATTTWRATKDRPWGEETDPAYRLALRGRPDPMGDGFADFAAHALAVFGPLLACLDDDRR